MTKRIVLISDTHEKHREVSVPDGDILVHAGDFTMTGKRSKYEDFAAWLNALPHQFKVCVAGNHDFNADRILRPLLNESVYMLNDFGVELDGIKFWGSPYTPRFGNWAYMEERGADIRRHWDMIPEETDVLITHGPPIDVLDYSTITRMGCGCQDLALTAGRVSPQIMVFGHIHSGYGHRRGSPYAPYTDFYNAAVVNESYDVANEPWVVDVDLSYYKGEYKNEHP
jgi:Icc-related predicted phosphoesterase